MKKSTIIIFILLAIIVVVAVGWIIPDFRATFSDVLGGVWFVATQAVGGFLAGIATTPIWQNYGNFISAGIMIPMVLFIAWKGHAFYNAITGAAMKKRINEFVPQGAPPVSTPIPVAPQQTPTPVQPIAQTEPVPQPEPKAQT